MSRTKKFFFNSFSTASYQLVLIVSGLLIPRIMLSNYGSEINGLITSVNQFIAYFAIVEAGISGAAIYALYKPLSEKDTKKISGIVSAARKFYIQAGYIFIGLTLGLSIFYPILLKTSSLSALNISLLVLILGIHGSLEFFTLSKYRVLLSADQKTYVISVASIVQIIISTSVIVIFGSLKVDIVVLRLIAVFSIFARSFILIIYTRMKYKNINYKEKPLFTELSRRWDALYLQVLGIIQNGSPVIILTIVTGDLKIISIYAIYSLVSISINSLMGIFNSGLTASFGEVIAKKEYVILRKSFREFELSISFIISVVFAVSFIMIMPFIRLYTYGISDINYYYPLIGLMININCLLYNIKTPHGMLVMSAGLFRETRKQSTIQGLLLLTLGTILTLQYGIVGLLIGASISNLYRTVELSLFVSKNITSTSPKYTFKLFFASISTIIIVFVAYNLFSFSVSSYVDWVYIASAIGVFSIMVSLTMHYLIDKETLHDVIIRVINTFKKKKKIGK